MKIFARLFFGLCASFVSLSGFSQVVEQADIVKAYPAISRDEVGFTACGVQVIAGVLGSKTVDSHSIYITANVTSEKAVGLIKVGRYNLNNTLAENGSAKQAKPITPGPVGFWIAKSSDGRSLNPIKYFSGDDPGFLIAGATFQDSFEIVNAIAAGEAMQAAQRYSNEKSENIVGFRVQLSNDESSALRFCMSGLIDRAKKLYLK